MVTLKENVMSTRLTPPTPQEILRMQSHRPWKTPDTGWLFYQEWHEAIFLHWKVDPGELRRFVPDELPFDLYNGEAWVSVIAFRIKNIRPKYLPSFPPVSDFDEINIRTYVKYNNKPGIYFLQLDASKWLSEFFAKVFSELPYRYSSISSDDDRYRSLHEESGDMLDVNFTVIAHKKDIDKRDRWLTERYVFFQDSKGYINELEIHHPEWPLGEVILNECVVKYDRFSSLISGQPDLVHFSPGVQVLTWGKNRLTPGKKNKTT
jgi:uncharacterized protein